MSGQSYAANTNNAFLLNDTTVIAQALLEGLDPSAVQQRAVDGLLEHRSKASRETFAREILKRLSGLDAELLECLTGPTELRRTANLYTWLRYHRLLREFFVEVLQEKRRRWEHQLRPTDVAAFFTHKLSAEPVIAKWSDETLRKVRSNMLLVLTDAQVLEPVAESVNLLILPVFLPVMLRSVLERVGRPEELEWFA
jgi:Putative inner membrane protein (DUF1819)